MKALICYFWEVTGASLAITVSATLTQSVFPKTLTGFDFLLLLQVPGSQSQAGLSESKVIQATASPFSLNRHSKFSQVRLQHANAPDDCQVSRRAGDA